MAVDTLKTINDIVPLLLSNKLIGEQPTRIASETIAVEVAKQTAGQMKKTVVGTLQNGKIEIPENLFGNGSTVVNSKVSFFLEKSL